MPILNANQEIIVSQDDGSWSPPIPVQLTTVKPAAVYEYVERLIRHPHQVLCDIEYHKYFRVGAEVRYGDRVYNVIYVPLIEDVGGPVAICDHMQIYLEDSGIKSA